MTAVGTKYRNIPISDQFEFFSQYISGIGGCSYRSLILSLITMKTNVNTMKYPKPINLTTLENTPG